MPSVSLERNIDNVHTNVKEIVTEKKYSPSSIINPCHCGYTYEYVFKRTLES